MSKDKISDYDTTAANNTDVGGTDIQGSAAVRNMDNGLRTIMSHLANLNTGVSFIHDTFKIADADAETKIAKFDAGSITAGQTRTYTFPDKDGTFAMAADVPEISNIALIDSSDDGSKNTALNIPSGTTAQEPTTPNGVQIRYDTTLNELRFFNGSAYEAIGAVLDEDDFASDSATKAPSQQSTKVYADGLKIQLGTAVASTSGTAIDFTSIPASVRKITVNFEGVSMNAAAFYQIQLGDSGGFETTGYSSVACLFIPSSLITSSTTGLVITRNATASAVHSGTLTLDLLDASSNKWVMSSMLADTATNYLHIGSGSKGLSGELDRVRITTTTGTPTFDLGNINISWEF
ncbi:hypothetical protein [Lentilitoribacter sp. Alg239-R112]|uniref:hypothetical protein n=1 Tax=Lentilitoribacter sp. Alg239-R112 TaxID=2305987 RepID=UPI0013A6FC03|nr:hypothetical protein [Lentilitoribacter sp. Alg239-R112]